MAIMNKKNPIFKILKYFQNLDRFWKLELEEASGQLLHKVAPPNQAGILHPQNPWISRKHPNGQIMWHTIPEIATKIDYFIANPKNHEHVVSKLPKTHQKAYWDVVNSIISDPTRHFIPTAESGKQVLRARHIKALLDGRDYVNIDASDPNYLVFSRDSHSSGLNMGAKIKIKVPIKKGAL